MGSLNNSVDTVNAAATAIVTAESRVQPTTIPKKRWGSWWSLYWCFGSTHKSNKRIGHAVLVPEPVAPAGPAATVPPNPSTTIVMPFIVPPSSPASFLQSDPPSATHSPAGLLSLTVNSYSSGGPASIFTIGPYAYETQLVSPPVFSNFTTEPSTASFTPPPESVQMTTPSSPEVPFAQLLASSLDRARKNNGIQKFALHNYEFQPYQQHPGSPGGQLISPGSAISTSGTCTPYPEKRPTLEFYKGESPRILGFEHFSSRKWSSRVGSGSLTPDGTGQGSRLGSGSLTPDGAGLASRLGSGCATPDGLGQDSRLGSGSLTPDSAGPTTKCSIYVQNQISEVASLANSENVHQSNAPLVDHRVSFELTGEEIARCLANKTGALLRNVSQSSQGILAKETIDRESIQKDSISCCDVCSGKTNYNPNSPLGEERQCCQKHQSVNSSKEFNFDNRKGDVSANAAKEGRSANSWAFFPLLQPEI
ncbi:hypothetical protein HN51_071686 [Arachis hypogaea]|uniref:Hydroxyproline-rich glycoprotein family protein n=1 Tax=Arachis hypogaea TaxID=3818 RepID=A0A444YXG4_ARAHY|nr:uncharacterized protein LOC107644863 [Arachis ipaensis]XP_025656888.1 uncharacterized protein LOC112751826 [Arachis hypogaea]QHO14305.1 uncharacterized protein DS421_15g523000 [Arachis hypogaea]RYR06630.1 hypothetical protein Ahy_B05g073941 [Arachis hypogaea]